MKFHFVWSFLVCLMDFDSGRGGQNTGQRTKDFAAVAGTEQVFAGPFRMRHQSHNVSLAIADTCDAVPRAVYVRRVGYLTISIAITKDHPVVPIQFRERGVVADKISFR